MNERTPSLIFFTITSIATAADIYKESKAHVTISPLLSELTVAVHPPTEDLRWLVRGILPGLLLLHRSRLDSSLPFHRHQSTIKALHRVNQLLTQVAGY
jgi:hypothetical protein